MFWWENVVWFRPHILYLHLFIGIGSDNLILELAWWLVLLVVWNCLIAFHWCLACALSNHLVCHRSKVDYWVLFWLRSVGIVKVRWFIGLTRPLIYACKLLVCLANHFDVQSRLATLLLYLYIYFICTFIIHFFTIILANVLLQQLLRVQQEDLTLVCGKAYSSEQVETYGAWQFNQWLKHGSRKQLVLLHHLLYLG